VKSVVPTEVDARRKYGRGTHERQQRAAPDLPI